MIWNEYYNSEEQEFWEGDNARQERIKNWHKICDATGKCDRCSPHSGCNSTRKYKFKNKKNQKQKASKRNFLDTP